MDSKLKGRQSIDHCVAENISNNSKKAPSAVAARKDRQHERFFSNHRSNHKRIPSLP